MTLVVGTDSYVTLASADSYWSDRNNEQWSSATTAEKQKALREATQYLDGAYSFIGTINDVDQRLAWPRVGAIVTEGNFKYRDIDPDAIPIQIQDAARELALEALTTRLSPNVDDSISSVKIDVIEVEYSEFAPSKRTFDFVSMILRGLTEGSKYNLKLTRV